MIDLALGFDVPTTALHDIAAVLRSRRPEAVERGMEDILRVTPRNEILAALAKVVGLPFFPGAAALGDKGLLKEFDSQVMRRGRMIPIALTEERLTVAICDPYNSIGRDYCEQNYQDRDLVFVMIPVGEIEHAMGETSSIVSQSDLEGLEDYRTAQDEVVRFDLTRDNGDQSDAVVRNFLRDVFNQAIAKEASDIHFFTEAAQCYYKFRIHGDLTRPYPLEPKLKPLIDAVLLHLVRKSPEEGRKSIGIDGRMALVHGAGRIINCRYVRHRSMHGYKAVIRILDRASMEPKLGVGSLSFSERTLFYIRKQLLRSNGIIINSGPTGSGKSTTTEAMLREVKDDRYNIVQLENPVESEIRGVVHCDMLSNDEFEDYMRALLRADPDIIGIGEIRDKASAKLAVEAALTGHQVFTTIHTPSAAQILTRMKLFGIDKVDLADTLRLLCAQRLVQVVCDECAMSQELTGDLAKLYNIPEEHVGRTIKRHSPEGCSKCNHLGYKGRHAVLEILPIDEEIADRIATEDVSALMLQRLVYEKYSDLKSLQVQGVDMLLAGETDIAGLSAVI